MDSTPKRILLLAVPALVAAIALGAVANAAMRSERLSPKLCLTKGGGKMVKIPGFPGERIDRRLLRDVKMMIRRYDIYITDGYSKDSVHSANGEHPVGLALDIVPNKAAGGSWRKVSKLAKWAEPQQNAPRAPFRWVGYNGDANHGRGHHLHLSWNHIGRHRFGRPMKGVYSIKCPRKGDGGSTQPPPDDGDGGTDGGKRDGGGAGTGGVSPGDGGSTSGGISPRMMRGTSDAPIVETGGVETRR
jgi:hypothetical protein